MPDQRLYAKLDSLLLDRIGRGASARASLRDDAEIQSEIRNVALATRRRTLNILDSRLQALRSANKIINRDGGGWQLQDSSESPAARRASRRPAGPPPSMWPQPAVPR